jgi:hypothetical protein
MNCAFRTCAPTYCQHCHCEGCDMKLWADPAGGYDNAKPCTDCSDSMLCMTCPDVCPHCASVTA